MLFRSVNLAGNLRVATPVDTGNARAAWIPSIGAPVLLEQGDPARAGEEAAVLLDRGAIIPLGTKRFVSNGTGYIRRLNAGSSSQAPAGFVQAEIRRSLLESR